MSFSPTLLVRWFAVGALMLSTCAEIAGQGASTVTVGPAGVQQSISGQVADAVTGHPIGRVLVRSGAQAMLTDYQGRFQFFTDAGSVTLTASKPGYEMSEDPAESGTIALQAPLPDTPVLIRMYPEAVVTGTVTAPGGDPIPGIMVQPHRIVYDESGHHGVPGAPGRTNSHGRYRLALMAGDYSLQTLYAQPSSDRTQAVLPVRVPAGGSSESSGLIHLRSGIEEEVDLHPAVRPMGSITVRFDPPGFQRNVRLTARLSDGPSFPVRQNTGEVDGETTLILPCGSYTLEARAEARSLMLGSDQARRGGAEGFEQAEAQVMVGGHEVGGSVVLHFASMSPIPVEMAVETSGTSDNAAPPTVEQLGLTLESARGDQDEPRGGLERITARGDQQRIFNPAPGSYRLRAQAGSWYIRSASYGTSDLLRQDLAVTQGASALPIRLVISHGTASLAGTLRMNGQGAPGWIYIVATTPSATPVITVHASSDGSYISAALPPGSYRVIAFEHRQTINFEDPETLAEWANRMQAVSLSAGDKGTLNLLTTSLPESH